MQSVFRMFQYLAVAAVLEGCVVYGTAAASLKESWYLDRGRANMEIGNYKAAIEAFQEVVKINPNNREGMRTLGLAYELQGLTAKAIEQFDKYLEKFHNDVEIAFKQADYLGWSRYAYRKKDAIKYYRMGLKIKNDPEQRHKLARLLAEDKATLDQALVEYQRVLRDDPKDRTVRETYRKLLLWDKRYLKEAIREYERLAAQQPDNFDTNYQLAKLLAHEKSRYDDAIKYYTKLITTRSDDLALRAEYANLLAKSKTYFDAAKVQFEQILSKDRSVPTRLAYADLLASRTSTREQALNQYKLLVDQVPGNTQARMKYARLLGAQRETVAAAIEQYRTVLEREPKNSEAHWGVAQAYAWLGYNDQSLHHTRLALQSEPRNTQMATLRRTLMQGREPMVESNMSFVTQPGDQFGLQGYALTFRGQGELSPFMTNVFEVGTEQYWNADDQVKGALLKLGTRYRISPLGSVEGSFGLRSLRRTGNGYEFRLQYNVEGQSRSARLGFKRELKENSLLALAGSTASGPILGAASSNRFYADLRVTSGRLMAEVSPYLGWVSAASVSPNLWLGTDFNAALSMTGDGPLQVALTYALQAAHYGRDHGGFAPSVREPLPGGYFSPRLFLDHNPEILFRYTGVDGQEIELKGGPSYQFVKDATRGTDKTGITLYFSYQRRFHNTFHWTVTAAYTQVADVYSRFFITNLVRYTFF